MAALVQEPRMDRNLEPWLRSVVRRRASFLARGRIRRSDREFAVSTASEEGGAGDAAPTDELLQRGEKHRQLANAVMALRDPYRSVLLLRYFEDLTPAQIAKRNGIPAATVRSQLKRGLDELREELDELTGEDRRTWCLALVPIAVDETSRGSLALSTVLFPLIAMQVLVKLALPLSVLALGAFLIHNDSTAAAEPDLAEARASTEVARLRSVQLELDPTEGRLPNSDTERTVNSNRRAAIAPTVSTETATSPMKGMIIDAATDKPVFDFAIDLYFEGEKLERVTSDALGQFESTGSYAAGNYEYEVVDREGVSLDWWLFMVGGSRISRAPQKGELAFRPGDTAIVSIELGPTYQLLLVGTAEALSAEYTGWLDGADAHSGSRNGLTTSTPVRQIVRDSELCWLRFQPTKSRLSVVDGPWHLALKSSDGLWFAEAEIDPGEGVHREPVELRLMATASFSVLLAGSNGEEIRKPMVYLAPADGGDKFEVARDLDGVESKFTRGQILPGKYLLTVRADNAFPFAEEVLLRGGEASTREIELESRSSEMCIHGELVSQSGSYHGQASVILRGLDGDSMHSFLTEWELRDGEWYAPIIFDKLPSARFQLAVYNWNDNRRWSGAPLIVDRSVDDLVLTCLDEVPIRDLEFVVEVSPEEQAPDYVELIYGWNGLTEGTARKRYGQVLKLGGVSVDSDFDWYVHADGFAPVWGGMNDFTGGAELGEVRVQLTRGWGARIRVVTGGSVDPIPLAATLVFGDGVLLGETDGNGELELQLDAEPALLELRHPNLPNLVIVGGDFDGQSGQLIGEKMMYEIEVGKGPR